MSEEEIYEYEKKYERVSKETEQYGRTQFVGKIIELEQQLQECRSSVAVMSQQEDVYKKMWEHLKEEINDDHSEDGFDIGYFVEDLEHMYIKEVE